MRMKKNICAILACAMIFGAFSIPVAEAKEAPVMQIMEMRATGEFSFDIPAKTLMKASSGFPMEYGETVKITASYMQDGQSIWHLIRTILERYIFIMPVVLRRIIVMRKENLGKDTRGTKNMAIRLLEIIMEKRVAHQKIQKNTALISLSG